MEMRPDQLDKPQTTSRQQADIEQVVDRNADRALSALAHGAVAFGVLGISMLVSLVISGIIWLYARRSPTVRFHSEQAGCYQCSVLAINVVLFIVLVLGGGLSLFTAWQGKSDWGLGWVVLAGVIVLAVWYVGTIVYGVVAAVMVLMGKPFKYPVIGDKFEREMRKAKRET